MSEPILDDTGGIVSTSKENVKDFGEVMTPPHIVEAMLAQIPEEAWSDPEYVFLEPACGTGNFLIAVLEKRLQHGIDIETALNTLIGMDCNTALLNKSRQRLMTVVMREGIQGEALQHYVKIIRNNVFWVEDSLAFIKSGELQRKFA